MNTLELISAFFFGFFLALLPMLVALISKTRELTRVHDGYTKSIDEWQSEYNSIREQYYNAISKH